ncbi:MAG: sigma-70 family RNA polymerase sigma factor [Steroidobacteraceae bacterium]
MGLLSATKSAGCSVRDPAAEPAAAAAAVPDGPDGPELRARVARDGRDAAFAVLLPRFEDKVYRLCLSIVRRPAEAEELAQESLLKVWRALDGYDGRASVSTWIYAIVRNTCFSDRRRRRELPLDEAATGQLEATLDPRPGAAERTGAAEESRAVRSALASLSEVQRRVVELFYWHDRSHEEVGRLLGLPIGTVKTHLHRARQRLAPQLQHLQEELP